MLVDFVSGRAIVSFDELGKAQSKLQDSAVEAHKLGNQEYLDSICMISAILGIDIDVSELKGQSQSQDDDLGLPDPAS